MQLRNAVCRFLSLRGVKRRSKSRFSGAEMLRCARNDNLLPLVTEESSFEWSGREAHSHGCGGKRV